MSHEICLPNEHRLNSKIAFHEMPLLSASELPEKWKSRTGRRLICNRKSIIYPVSLDVILVFTMLREGFGPAADQNYMNLHFLPRRLTQRLSAKSCWVSVRSSQNRSRSVHLPTKLAISQ